jgi:hypothetical protein
MRFLPTWFHGAMDYAMGAMLIVIPFAFRFPTEASAMIPVALGIGVILYSGVTDYELGAYPVIGMPIHLLLDVAGGLLLAASPWLFDFEHLIWMPHVAFGALEIGTALVTQTRPQYGPAGTRTASVD